jgi:hypothetical protein
MKKITSLTLGFAFLTMSYTGIMLYFVPKGKIAYWADWHLWGLSKTQYGDIHTTSMVTFVLFGILHIYYNWKPIVSYLKDKNKKISFTKKEFLIAFGLNAFFVIGTLFMIQPFKAFLDLESDIKDSWTKQYGEPPYGHAEESKLKVFCRKIGVDYNEAGKILSSNNITFKSDDTLLDISKNNNITPSYIHKLITASSTKKISDDDIPSSLGRKTLQELNDMQKINLKQSISFLITKGITDANPDSRIKYIADELGVMPIDVYQVLIKKAPPTH